MYVPGTGLQTPPDGLVGQINDVPLGMFEVNPGPATVTLDAFCVAHVNRGASPSIVQGRDTDEGQLPFDQLRLVTGAQHRVSEGFRPPADVLGVGERVRTGPVRVGP